MCPYFSSENINVSVNIIPTFEELPIIEDPRQPGYYGQQDDSIISDQIKELIEKFDDPQEDILGTTIDVTTNQKMNKLRKLLQWRVMVACSFRKKLISRPN
jgi:hypothetical protein